MTRIAVLVDADNVNEHNIDFAVSEAAKSGTVTIRRAFGRLSSIRGREKALTRMGFAAEVALPGAKSKDTADLLLAQYAVRLAERRAVDLIALVSSDSDFAAIARGIAESGVECIGYGRPDVGPALREAFSHFTPFPAPPRGRGAGKGADRDDLAEAAEVIRRTLGKTGQARTNAIGQQLTRAFDGDYKKALGVKTLGALLKKLAGDFEIRDIKGKEGAVAAKMVVEKPR